MGLLDSAGAALLPCKWTFRMSLVGVAFFTHPQNRAPGSIVPQGPV